MVQLPQRTKGKPWRLKIQSRVRVGKDNCWGYCDHTAREIVLSRATEKHGVDRQVFIHELLHKIMPWLDEAAVDHAATELDDALELMETQRENLFR